MKDIVLITGMSGMVGQELAQLISEEYTVRFLTRNKSSDNAFHWDIARQYIDADALVDVKHVIHLAGASIGDKKWSNKRKEEILSSRIDSVLLLKNELKKNNIKLDSFISASAIGYYGAVTTEEVFNENSNKGNDFLAEVCSKWEEAVKHIEESNLASRTAIVRIGVVLSSNGGVLEKLLTPIKHFVGAGLGSGNQYLPWIHIQDLCRIFKFLLDNKKIKGTFNAVSPEHIHNKYFIERVAKVLNRPIILPNVPIFILKVLLGEMSAILLEGSRVSSEKIIVKGFNFKYKKIDEALKNLLLG